MDNCHFSYITKLRKKKTHPCPSVYCFSISDDVFGNKGNIQLYIFFIFKYFFLILFLRKYFIKWKKFIKNSLLPTHKHYSLFLIFNKLTIKNDTWPIKVNGQSATIKLLLMSMASQPKALKDLEHQQNHPPRFWRRMFFWGSSFEPCQNPKDP